MKCKECRLDITQEELEKVPQKDRQGNVKTAANGKIMYYNYHKTCWEKKNREKQFEQRFWKYVRQNFFTTLIPNRLYSELTSKYKPHYSWELLYEYIVSIEDSLLKNYTKCNFESDWSRANYISSAISNNIQAFKEKTDKKVIEEESVPVINFEVYKKVEQKQEETSDYDFLE